jgi:hypothetical protein
VGWWPDRKRVDHRVDTDEAIHYILKGAEVFGGAKFNSGKIIACGLLNLTEESVMTGSSSSQADGVFCFDLWLMENSLDAEYHNQYGGPSGWGMELDRFFRALAEWILDDVSPHFAFWGGETDHFKSSTVTESDLRSPHYAFLLPRTHPLTSVVKGEPMGNDYLLYDWKV